MEKKVFLLVIILASFGICSAVFVPEFLDAKMEKQLEVAKEISSMEEIPSELRKKLILSKDEEQRQDRN